MTTCTCHQLTTRPVPTRSKAMGSAVSVSLFGGEREARSEKRKRYLVAGGALIGIGFLTARVL